MLKRSKLYIGISLVASAVTLVVTFIVLCIKKKNIGKALLAIAALEGGVGAALILSHLDDENKLSPCRGIFREDKNFEFFDDDEVGDTNKIVSFELEDNETVSYDESELKYKLKFEIPRDEEATEADFQE